MAQYKLVAYDLHHGSQQAYQQLISAIQRAGYPAIEIERSVWVIQTETEYDVVLNYLKPFISPNDKLLVSELTTGAWVGIPGLKKFLNV